MMRKSRPETRMLNSDLRTPQERTPLLSPALGDTSSQTRRSRALTDTNEPTERTIQTTPIEWNWDMSTGDRALQQYQCQSCSCD